MIIIQYNWVPTFFVLFCFILLFFLGAIAVCLPVMITTEVTKGVTKLHLNMCTCKENAPHKHMKSQPCACLHVNP